MRNTFFLLLALCLFLVACQSNQPVLGRAVTEQEKQQSVMLDQENQVIFIDQKLVDSLKIVKFQATRNDMGMLVVRVYFQTNIDEDVPVDAKCNFIHKDESMEDTPWKPNIIKRHEIIPVQFTSLSPSAAKFNVLVRFTK
ncbi:MAG: hypothetical protein HUU50_16880 [Candidatus Brocadiae bacterium]|nr:hypothetical protein [Candidatus Brocadiia bacterium]